MARYSIKDLERITGIKAHTIRMWERRYDLIKPKRTSTNIRYYTDCNLKRLLNIAILNHNGIKISHIAKMNDDELCERVLELSINGRNCSVHIESLMVAMLELDQVKFSGIMSNTILKCGLECCVETILFPFLERVGLLWQAGSINPAQEHFMSNLIRQKLFSAIDNEMQNHIYDSKGPCVTMFLPEDEYHEIGLLFFNLIARKEGADVVYLGSSVPFENLELVNKIKPADLFVFSFVSSVSEDNMSAYINSLKSKFPLTPIVVTGSRLRELNMVLPVGVEAAYTADQLRGVIRSLR
ncbi:MerR family transcriptional regulator [Marinilabiliaceae bacterium ANBcel2]|nr:MerR family transcriptional regulator [Marinilabiliaceae bacterium ANBcel2]